MITDHEHSLVEPNDSATVPNCILPMVDIRELSITLGRTPVLKKIDLSVPSGSIYSLVGPNGAGKTTLIKSILNILHPSSGRVHVLGMDSRHISGSLFTRIGYVSENQELPGWMTVDYFLKYLRPFYPTWDKSLEDRLYQQFNLPGFRKIDNLSRGQKMKLSFLSTLPYHPPLIILDEPFAGLDLLVRSELTESLLEQAEEATILLSSHDLADLENFATHIGFLHDGQLLFSEEILPLLARFREIEITFDSARSSDIPLNLKTPISWLIQEQASSVIRVIHDRADSEPLQDQINHVYPDNCNFRSLPMTLKSIFMAVAKSCRTNQARSVS